MLDTQPLLTCRNHLPSNLGTLGSGLSLVSRKKEGGAESPSDGAAILQLPSDLATLCESIGLEELVRKPGAEGGEVVGGAVVARKQRSHVSGAPPPPYFPPKNEVDFLQNWRFQYHLPIPCWDTVAQFSRPLTFLGPLCNFPGGRLFPSSFCCSS